MRRTTFLLAAVFVAALLATGAALAESSPGKNDRTVTVMT